MDPRFESEIIRHEAGHRFLTPLGDSKLAGLRRDLDQWFYKRSAIMRVLEEGGVHTYGTRSPLSGAAWPFRGGYSLKFGRADPIAAALLLTYGYSTYKVSEAVIERVKRPDDSE